MSQRDTFRLKRSVKMVEYHLRMSMVVAEHLHKTFGRFTAVKDASFTIEKGEIVGFLGPNGAGKTTTMKMLTGYLPPTAGTASIAGYDILDKSIESRRHLGYMPENVPLYDEMRVTDYLIYRSRLKGLRGSEIRKQVGYVIDTCGLEPKRKNLISTLSKGYRQRVGLADALLAKPDLLILDEPTNGLDPNQIRQIRELIRSLSENHTVILSTHILSEVEMICNKVIIIDQGEIKAADTPANLTQGLRAAGRVSIEFKGDLDIVVKDNIRHAIKEINEKYGTTVILTTHDIGDIEELCSRIIIIDEGKKIYDGTLADLKDTYGKRRKVTMEVRKPESLKELKLFQKIVDVNGVHTSENDYESVLDIENKIFSVSFDKHKMQVPQILSAVMELTEVTDIKLQETELAEIVKEIYNHGGV